MQKRLLIYLSLAAAVLFIAFGVYWRFSPKIVTKPLLDEHYNAVVFPEDQAFPYRPRVMFNLPVTWRIEGTLLNNTTTGDIGVSINPETGEITWHDKREGPFGITITASNRVGKDQQSFTARQIIKPLFEITFPPEIPALREFRGIVRTRGSLPIQYACPTAGITFDSRGVIWQKPEPGTYTVTFIASNQAGKCRRDWNVVVKAAPVRIISEPVSVVTEGDDYVYPVKATGTPKFTWELPERPEGMIIGREGVVFLPARYVKKGEYNVTVRVSNVVDGKKYSDTQHYTIRCVVREEREEEQPQEEEKKEKKKQEYAKAQVVPDVNVIVNKRKKDEVKEPVPEKEAPQKPEEKPAPPPPQPQVLQEEERKEQERIREEEQKRMLEAQKKLEEERLQQEKIQKLQEEMQRLEAQKRAEEEKQRLETQRKAEEEKKQQEEAQRRQAEEQKRLEEQKKAEEVKKRQEDQKRLEQQKKAEAEAARLREEQKNAEHEKRRREEQRKAKEEKAQAEKQGEEKQVAVPTKKEMVREKTEKGKKVKLTYDFVLEGWSFNDFYELSRASGFKILFISPFKGVEEKNYEVSGIDSQGRLVVQMQPLDENNYSKKGCMVVDIPAEGQDSWRTYETHLREQLKKGSHSLVVFFPYSFMASLEDASKSYYAVHCADQKLPFEQGAGTVKFKITGDRFIKIVSMGN